MSQYPPPPQQPYGSYPQHQKKGMSTGVKVLLIVLGVVGGSVFLCCAGCLIWGAMLPEGGVRTATNMEQYATDYISSNSLLEPGESVKAYYDITVTGTSEECAIVTDRRLIHHGSSGNTSINLKDITSITHQENFGDVITVADKNGNYLTVTIDAFNNGQIFLQVLRDQADLAGAEYK